MGDKIHPTHFQVPEMPWKKDDKRFDLLAKIAVLDQQVKSLTETLESYAMTLEFYSLTFRCPKCGTYHSEDHKCFNCGFDHTAQD